MEEYILEIKGVSKFFPGVKALSDIHMKVRKGAVHALMGENGAGKSTLIKLLNGLYQPDAGEIWFNGEKVHIANAAKAKSLGIATIHQETNPVLDMRVCDNIFLGREPRTALGFVDDRKMIEQTKELFENLGVTSIKPTSIMRELSVSKIQMVEIAKAVSQDAQLILMDEPTSAITEQEVALLFKIVETLKSKGITIIYISHKVDEIYTICEDVTVLRDGKFIGSDSLQNVDRDKLFKWMVNRELGNYYYHEERTFQEEALRVEGITGENNEFRDISFSVRKGEILGIYGLMGAGRTEIAETIFGYRKKVAGKIFVDGKEVKINNVRDAIKNGIAMATEDRKKLGLFLIMSIKDNISISSLNGLCNKLNLVHRKQEQEETVTIGKSMNVKTPSYDQLAMNLSGGNQQKVVLCKWLMTKPKILILDEPTRGIDVGAKAEIYKIMNDLASQGVAIIMISSEMPEILGVADRIVVLREGDLSGEVNSAEATQEQLIRFAAASK